MESENFSMQLVKKLEKQVNKSPNTNTNTNVIATGGFSNPESEKMYQKNWPGEKHIQYRYRQGLQCGGCTYFAKFDSDWGLCCSLQSRHRMETVFEHFTCANQIDEGWDSHSFGV